ncbi:Proto-oncoprotein DBL [Mactra antiquata]
MGVPLLTFPTDSADLMDIYSTHDILDLMKVFVDLSGGKVAVVADLQNGWNLESTNKLYHLLEKLQTTRKGCLTSAYIIRSTTNNNLIHNIPLSSNKKLPANIIRHLDKLEDLYLYIDTTQLTTDYGGTLQYNHVTWVDFQRTYIPLITRANDVVKALPVLGDKIFELQEVAVDKCQDSDKMFRNIVKVKYEKLLNKHNVRGLVEDCQDSVDRLEHPDSDPTLVQIHVAIVTDTKFKIIKVLKDLEKHLDHLEEIVRRTRDEHVLFAKLKDCKDNTKEVEETIELMTSQADGLPLDSSSEEQAKYNRDVFNNTVLAPSQTKRWNTKASRFVSRHLLVHQKKDNFSSLTPTNKIKDTCVNTDITNCVIPKLKLNIDDDVDVTQQIRAPSAWVETLKHFFKKHPPPKKKHIRLLNKFAPHNVGQQCRSEAEVLAERTLFLLQFLMKDQFKLDDVVMIHRWIYYYVDIDVDHCMEVSVV